MRSRLPAAVLLAAAVCVLWLTPLQGGVSLRSPTTQAQLPASTANFEYDVLPGVGYVRPGEDGVVRPPTDVTMTSGWHYHRDDPDVRAIDLRARHGVDVYAVFRVVTGNDFITARVKSTTTTGADCRKVIIELVHRDERGNKTPLGD